jgi:hypothetical protein
MSAEQTHEVVIRSFHGHFVLEEVDSNEDLCLGHRWEGQYFAEGSTREVVVAATRLDVDDPWVSAVVRALERERRWKPTGYSWGRRNELEIQLGQGHMFHVSACANRNSIERHGLDWSFMGAAPGVAGSSKPELPGIFLQEDADDDFFVRMARFRTDVWKVNVEELWLESGPSGWWVVSEPIGPDRIELLPPRYPAT